MNQLRKTYFILFSFSVLFNLFFCGFYTLYTVYFLPYFQTPYEQFSFGPTGKIPTKTDLLLSGFQSSYVWLNSIVLGFILVLLSVKLKTFNSHKSRTWQTIYRSFCWTTLFSALYFVSEFIWYMIGANFSVNFTLGIIRSQLPLLMIFYFVFILPIAASLKAQ